MPYKQWINPIFIGLLILFSLPIKLVELQQWLESALLFSIPIRLSFYTLILPPIAALCLIWNRSKFLDICKKYRWPLTLLFFLFCWMWLGAITGDYMKLSLKHSGRYTIYLLTFFAFLFALHNESTKKNSQVFSAIYIILMVFTFLDHYKQLSIVEILENFGMKIDLFHSGVGYSGADWESIRNVKDNFIFMYPSSFFEHRNPYAVVSTGMFFWGLNNIRSSWFLSSLVIISALWSLNIAGSRNGLLTFFLVSLLLLILTIRKTRFSRTFLVFSLISSFFMIIIFFSIDSETTNRTRSSINRLISISSYKDLEKMDLRFTMYRVSFDIGVKSSSIFGYGTKTSGYKMFENSEDLASNFLPETRNSWAEKYNSHNALLTIWIEMGWVGLIAVLIFLWLWFRPALRGPPMLMMPMLAVCVGQILDYFIWEIFFMAFQSFFFAHFASSIYFVESKNIVRSSEDTD
mgnify:CR=1 FL=1